MLPQADLWAQLLSALQEVHSLCLPWAQVPGNHRVQMGSSKKYESSSLVSSLAYPSSPSGVQSFTPGVSQA